VSRGINCRKADYDKSPTAISAAWFPSQISIKSLPGFRDSGSTPRAFDLPDQTNAGANAAQQNTPVPSGKGETRREPDRCRGKWESSCHVCPPLENRAYAYRSFITRAAVTSVPRKPTDSAAVRQPRQAHRGESAHRFSTLWHVATSDFTSQSPHRYRASHTPLACGPVFFSPSDRAIFCSHFITNHADISSENVFIVTTSQPCRQIQSTRCMQRDGAGGLEKSQSGFIFSEPNDGHSIASSRFAVG